MPKQESIFSKICKGTTPFCIDLDEDDSYIIDTEIETEDNSNHK